MTTDREFLTPEDAEAMLPDGEYVHTYSNPAYGIMIGADWPRDEVVKLLRTHKAELAGPMATANGHGIAVLDEEKRLFIATRSGA
jgi:hypothetical protein